MPTKVGVKISIIKCFIIFKNKIIDQIKTSVAINLKLFQLILNLSFPKLELKSFVAFVKHFCVT